MAVTSSQGVTTYDIRKGIPLLADNVPAPGAAAPEFSSLIQTPKLYVGTEGPRITHFQVGTGCTLTERRESLAQTACGEQLNVAELTPNEECLISPNQPSGNVTTWKVDPTSGALTLVGTFHGVAPLPAAIVLAATRDRGLLAYTTAAPTEEEDPRLVARPVLLGECALATVSQAVSTGAERTVRLRNGVRAIQQ